MTLTAEHHAALAQVAAAAPVSPAATERLRKHFGEDVSRWILSAAELQVKARRKLGEDGVWWANERALQQASAWQVARAKAAWFGDAPVYDLCCGIGGDALQLARRGRLIAIDADPEIAAMAEANLRFHAAPAPVGRPDARQIGTPRKGTDPISKGTDPISNWGTGTDPVPGSDFSAKRVSVRCADVVAVDVDPHWMLHIDPGRRPKGRRATAPDRYQPAWRDVWHLAGRAGGAAIKLAPAARLDEAACAAGFRVWLSLGGSVREQTLLIGEVAQRAAEALGSCSPPAGAKAAVICRADGQTACYTPRHSDDCRAAITATPRAMLVDPDPAVRAAGLTETFALEHDLQCMGGPSGFLTGATCDLATGPDPVPLAVVGRVLWHGPSDDRGLRRQLRRMNVFPAVVKSRGTSHRPDRLARRLKDCGEQPVTLWIGRAGQREYAAVTVELETKGD